MSKESKTSLQSTISTTLHEHRVSIIGTQLTCRTCGPVTQTEEEHQSEAVTAALTEGATIQWGVQHSDPYAVSPAASEYNARVVDEAGYGTAVSRPVIYGPWTAS